MSSGHNKRMKMTPNAASEEKKDSSEEQKVSSKEQKDSAGPAHNIFQMLRDREIGIRTSYLTGDRWCCKVRSDQGGHKCLKLSREQLSIVRLCAFCDGEYRNYGDDGNYVTVTTVTSVSPTTQIPRITDDNVLRFFMLINRQNWTHVICRGLGVTTHDDLLRLRPEHITLKRNDAYPTELLCLITLEDRNYFRLKLVEHQQKHAAR